MLIGEKFTDRISTALTCNSRFNYADELNENVRNFSLANLMNKVSIWLVSIFDTVPYVPCTVHANDLQFLQLHKVGSRFFPGFFKPFISLTVMQN